MTEEELRAIVRETVERLRPGGPAVSVSGVSSPARPHASHLILPVHAGDAVDDGLCLIEPTVRCSHCSYCQSYGH